MTITVEPPTGGIDGYEVTYKDEHGNNIDNMQEGEMMAIIKLAREMKKRL